MRLSLARAWSESAALARREGRLIFPLAFLFLALPSALLQWLAPVTTPGPLSRGGAWLVALPLLFVLSLFGALAISALALGRSGGDSLRTAARRFPALAGAGLLTALGAALALAPLAMIGPGPMLAGLPLLLFFWARLLLVTPAAAAERLGPVALIARSWRLTQGETWKLVGFLILLIVVASAVLALANLVPAPPPATLLGAALLQAAIAGLATIFAARLYAQRAAGP